MGQAMELHSNSFKAGATIPAQFTCEGDDLSPHLSWMDAPKRTRSFVIIVEDPDAPKGIFTHWVAYNIPPDKSELPVGAGNKPDGFVAGKNDFGTSRYSGPCPPVGHGDHRYFFHIFALDKPLDVPPGATKIDVEKAMKNHIIDHAQMMGKFERF
jgi:Raf kinase inhibitor-like YbhB/YbcL family protein